MKVKMKTITQNEKNTTKRQVHYYTYLKYELKINIYWFFFMIHLTFFSRIFAE